jgi:hypothetical protein
MKKAGQNERVGGGKEPPRGVQPRIVRRGAMVWNAAVVLIIIVAFGSMLFALGNDLPRRPIE